MNILGVGPLELAFLLILAIIVLGPAEMIKLGKSAGKFIYKLQTSDLWSGMKRVSKDISNLPYKLAREAGLDEINEQLKNNSIGNIDFTESEIKDKDSDSFSSWTSPSSEEKESKS